MVHFAHIHSSTQMWILGERRANGPSTNLGARAAAQPSVRDTRPWEVSPARVMLINICEAKQQASANTAWGPDKWLWVTSDAFSLDGVRRLCFVTESANEEGRSQGKNNQLRKNFAFNKHSQKHFWFKSSENVERETSSAVRKKHFYAAWHRLLFLLWMQNKQPLHDIQIDFI